MWNIIKYAHKSFCQCILKEKINPDKSKHMNILLHSFLKTSCVVAKKIDKFSNTKLLRVGYCTPVPNFYIVLHGLRCGKKHFNGLINQSILRL